MLELKHLKKAYTTGTFTQVALNDVSISFRDSEFVAILGPSGSGKTTLLNVIGGLDQCDSGDLVIEGVSTKEYKDRDWDTYRNNRIGFVFQSYNLIPHQTVLSNVELALTLSGVEKEERRRRATEALERVGLHDHINKKPSQLSGGQMQRVAIARALVNNPDILLADEPTGALDSTTSVQIMDLLTEIAHDRLVVMVTHNPELAEQYANRIVNLHDGVIESDTNPFDPEEEIEAVSEKPTKKTSMSFWTALTLSFNNLMTKKGRTIMTAFAGSIGIIGIAAILALANGVNNYIASVEEETLSQYPLQITSSGFDLTSMLQKDSDNSDPDSANTSAQQQTASQSTDEVKVSKLMTNLFASVGTNDLASLKVYLDSGQAGIENDVRAVEYAYGITPHIYLSDTTEIKQVNPDTTFSAFSMGSSSSSFMSMSMTSSSNFFTQMPKEESLYINQYEVVAGHWPTNYNECVLVTSGRGYISDTLLYALGLRDSAEVKDMLKKLMNGEEVETPTDIRNYSYDEIIGLTYKVVNASDCYEYDGTYGVWKDKTSDDDYMRSLINASEELKIVGIVKLAEGQKVSALKGGSVYYPYALTEHLIEQASQSKIVQDQLADPLVDVITGVTFEEEAESSASALDMNSMFSIDSSAFQNAFKVDTSAMSFDPSSLADIITPADLPAFPQATPEMFADLGVAVTNETADAITQACAYLLAQYIYTHSGVTLETLPSSFATWAQDDSSTVDITVSETTMTVGVKDYLKMVVARATGLDNFSTNLMNCLTNYLTSAVTSYTQDLVKVVMTKTATAVATQMGAGMAGAINFDTSVMSSAFQFNLSGTDLTEVITSMMNSDERTYENNLLSFGYADLAVPTSISIYPKSFESKEVVTASLDSYNADMEATGQEEKVISYTDIVGALMSSVTEIVDMISAVLIAFVAISLVVSSIMIGVITYISVLERKKEIGILRAMGASKGDVSRVFNAETVIEGFIAGVLGVGVTAILCIPANAIVYAYYDVANVAILPIGAALILILISVVLTFIAGLIPSSAASRKDPVEALRSE